MGKCVFGVSGDRGQAFKSNAGERHHTSLLGRRRCLRALLGTSFTRSHCNAVMVLAVRGEMHERVQVENSNRLRTCTTKLPFQRCVSVCVVREMVFYNNESAT